MRLVNLLKQKLNYMNNEDFLTTAKNGAPNIVMLANPYGKPIILEGIELLEAIAIKNLL